MEWPDSGTSGTLRMEEERTKNQIWRKKKRGKRGEKKDRVRDG